MIETRTPQLEHIENIEGRRGRNTEISFTFVRHSQKTSGRVYTEDGSELIDADITEKGKSRAADYGREMFSDRQIKKAYATDKDRTRQTLEASFQAAGINPTILQKEEKIRAFFALPATPTSPEFRKKQEDAMRLQRDEYITEHFPGQKFEELGPDGQEEVAEFAEEPAFEWYLSFDNKRPDKDTPSPRELAASVAFKINRLINLPDFMPSDKSIDLVSAGHKTSTEAFLKYTLSREINGKQKVGLQTLAEIGGSLKILDSWDLQIKNNENGEKSVILVLRRENGETKQYGLDLKTVQELAREYFEQNGFKPLKIDSL